LTGDEARREGTQLAAGVNVVGLVVRQLAGFPVGGWWDRLAPAWFEVGVSPLSRPLTGTGISR
jgi:hypothetical protein